MKHIIYFRHDASGTRRRVVLTAMNHRRISNPVLDSAMLDSWNNAFPHLTTLFPYLLISFADLMVTPTTQCWSLFSL